MAIPIPQPLEYMPKLKQVRVRVDIEKRPHSPRHMKSSCIFYKLWCSIKYDHRTLTDLEGVTVVENYANFDEEERDKL